MTDDAAALEDPVEHLRRDPALEPLVEEHGPLAVEPAEDTFRRMTVSIINQQLSTASADAIRERVFERFEVTPEAFLAADEAELRELGLSRQKVRYLRNVAEAYAENGYSVEYFDGMTDAEAIEELTAITGVGAWTAKMVLMFCLGREDVFPVEDLGIRKGMVALFGEMDRPEMVERAEAWRPYRSYASRYLWRAYD